MAIKIPSKNIYEMANKKIKDNIVSKIEISQSVIEESVSTEIVFSKEWSGTHLEEYLSTYGGARGNQEEIYIAYDNIQDIDGNPHFLASLSAILIRGKSVLSDIIRISRKIGNNKYLQKVTPDLINFSVLAKHNFGESNFFFNPSSLGVPSGGFGIIKALLSGWSIPSKSSPSSTEDGTLSLPNRPSVTNSFFIGNKYNDAIVTPRSRILTSSANIGENFSKPNDIHYSGREDDEFVVETAILAEYTIYTFRNNIDIAYANDFPYDDLTKEIKGEYEDYVATKVEISIQGEVWQLKTNKETKTFGNGGALFSLGGNELLQDGAKVINDNGETSLTEHLANNILTQYANGKETATLLCDIADYYEDDILKISPNSPNLIPFPYYDGNSMTADGITYIVLADGGVKVSGTATNGANWFGLSVKRFSESDLTCYSNTLSSSDGKVCLSKSGGIAHLLQVAYDSRNSTIFINVPAGTTVDGTVYVMLNKGTKKIDYKPYREMSFRLHDEVIPYVRGADGQDRPMSKYQDGSPKVFEVTGTNMIYDGAVWQELTLLEKIQENT